MKIALGQDDSPDFIDIVEGLVNGLLIGDAPPSLMLIKIDNWFGSKWLGFSGKILGALGVSMGKLTIPPFVPNHVLSERKVIGPPYSEAKHDSPIHISVPIFRRPDAESRCSCTGSHSILVQRWFLKIWTGQCHGLRSYRRRLLQLVRGMGLQRILASREMDRGPARGSSEVDEQPANTISRKRTARKAGISATCLDRAPPGEVTEDPSFRRSECTLGIETVE
jgi:hypothetical protein